MRVLLLLALLPLAACQSQWEREAAGSGPGAPASGAGEKRSYAATGFTGVDLRGSDDVDVRIAENFSVRAEGDPRVLDRLDIRVEHGNLRVGRRDDAGKWLHHDEHGVKIYVTMPKLVSASVAGSGNLTAERADGDFSGAISGSGDLKLGALAGGAADLAIAGSGELTIAGSASRLKATIAGSGDIDARGLTAASAAVSIAGSGGVRGTVKGEASVSIAGSGDVELVGGAKCSVSSFGSGNARCS